MSAFFETNQKGEIVAWSEQAENILGWTKEEATDIDQLNPEPPFPENSNRLDSGSISFTSKTGVKIMFGGSFDKGSWFLNQESQTRSELTQSTSLDSAHDGLVGIDLDKNITSSNSAAESIYSDKLIDKNAEDIFSSKIIKEIEKSIAKDEEASSFKSIGNGKDLLVKIQPVKDISQKIIGAAIAIRDISEEETAKRELDYLKTHNKETGLIDRSEFIKQLDRELLQSGSSTVIIINIDHFKLVNDSYGHETGDLIIQKATEIIQKYRQQDIVPAYFGADEFAIFIKNEKVAAEDLTEAIIETFKKETEPIALGEISISAGIASDGDSAESIIIAADSSLFDAKESGGGIINIHKPDEKSGIMLVEELKYALYENRALLYKQPIQNIETGEIDRHELLLRVDLDGEIHPPGPFLESAERFGLSEEIDMFVIDTGIEFAATGETVEINLSGPSLNSPTLIESIDKKLRSSHCNPSDVIFEITETSAVGNFNQARQLIYNLTELGCKFMLDDFGTGFGSFSYLKHLPVEGIKIDGDFVKNLTNSEIDQRIISAIVMIAEALEKETVAEWVRDQQTLDLLNDLGINYAQGYFIGEPEPIEYNKKDG